MSLQAETWMKHTCHYLDGVDAALTALFLEAMARAGYPGVTAPQALEAICADFLAGAVPSRRDA